MKTKIEAAFVDMLAARSALDLQDLFGFEPGRRDVRRQRTLGLGRAWTVGTITAYNGVTIKHMITGSLTGTAAVTGDNAPSRDISRSNSHTQTYGTSGAETGNQFLSFIFTATKNTTTSLDLSGVLTDAFAVAAATLTCITAIWIEYLTSTQDATNGSNVAATADVKIKFGASNPATSFGPLGTDGFFYIGLGEKFYFENHDTTGWAVTAATADTIDFVHAVNDFDAKFRITIFGRK